MASLHLRHGSTLIAGALASAVALGCSSAQNGHASGAASTGGGGSSTNAFSQSVNEPTHAGGTGGKGATQNPPSGGDGAPRAEANAAGAAGAESTDSDIDQAHQECTFGETCVSKCTATKVTCGIESPGFACEFDGFVGASTTVSCGERAVIGTACCGGCGCVPVEVYFDGTHCWEGVPQCTIDQFSNKVFDPHDPTPADAPPFTPPSNVPGIFTLGAGATGGTTNAGGAGGSLTTISGGGGSGRSGADDGGSAGSDESGAAGASGGSL